MGAPAHRTDPLEILALQATTRVPDLVPIRYGRMAASPFAFFRGAAAVMAVRPGLRRALPPRRPALRRRPPGQLRRLRLAASGT